MKAHVRYLKRLGACQAALEEAEGFDTLQEFWESLRYDASTAYAEWYIGRVICKVRPKKSTNPDLEQGWNTEEAGLKFLTKQLTGCFGNFNVLNLFPQVPMLQLRKRSHAKK